MPPRARVKFSRDALKERRRTALRPAPRTAEPAMGMDEALETLRGAPAAVRDIQTAHRAATAEQHRQVNSDPGLNAEGRKTRLAELRAEANKSAAQATAQLRARIEQAQAALATRAERAKPKPAGGLEAMMARQVAWSRVREMLENDVPLDEVLAEADPETLHSMAEELPAFLRVAGLGTDRRGQMLRAVDDQLAHVAGGRVLEAHEAAREAEVHVARVGPLLGFTDALGAGRVGAGNSSLQAAFASELAAQQAAGRLDPADDDTDEARDPAGRAPGLAAAYNAGMQRQQAAPGGDAA